MSIDSRILVAVALGTSIVLGGCGEQTRATDVPDSGVSDSNSTEMAVDANGRGRQDASIDDAEADSRTRRECPPPESVCEAAEGHTCWYVAPGGNDDADGSIEHPFATIQHGVDQMQPGDYLYLRGGRYAEHTIGMRGKRGSEDAWFTLKSYPCEWAIVDPGHPDEGWGVSVFYTHGTHTTGPTYWRFEHFEVTGAGPSTEGRTFDEITSKYQGAGFHFWPGYHLQFHYMYIHDNYGGGSNNGGAGIKIAGEGGEAGHHIEITHCYLSNNGWPGSRNHNLGNIILFSDYRQDPAEVDIDKAQHSNEIAYNLVEGSATGIKTKNSQRLVRENVGNDMEAKDRGNRIHHNIFIDNKAMGIWMAQDFVQIHHNVITGSSSGIVNGNPPSTSSREPFYAVVHNNLVVSALAGITSYHSTSSSLVTYETEPWHPFWYVWNNIVEQGRNSDGYNDINVLFARSDHELDMDTVHIDGNYFYPRSPTDPVINVVGQHNDFSGTEYMASGWATKLYANTENAADPLHEAAQPYKTRTGHILTASTTLSTGGTGGAHPYLDGVSIPSYVGPCADDACVWMDEVELLRDVASLRE